jgi:SAM-dependent methyltransferase
MGEAGSMHEVYEEYYRRVAASRAYSRFCELCFGRDYSQDGFSDMDQLDLMIGSLGLGPGARCLDLGCGGGGIASYVAARTGAIVDGLDGSPVAIDAARLRAEGSAAEARGAFRVADINRLDLSRGLYSAIYLIDSLYFSDDYEATLSTLRDALAPGGRLGLLYSEFLFEPSERRRIDAKETRLAMVLAGLDWSFEAVDLTREHYEFMRRKRLAAEACRLELEAEGNAWLYERARRESIDPEMDYEDFRLFSNRFFYSIDH